MSANQNQNQNQMNNTLVRSLSGIVFLSVLIGGLLLGKWTFGIIFLFILVVMMSEFYKMTMGGNYMRSRILATVAGAISFCLIFAASAFPGTVTHKMVALSVLPYILLMSTSIFTKNKEDYALFADIYTGIMYIAVPCSLASLVVFDETGVYSGIRMISFFIIIWASDIGAYCVGMLLGRNGKKLCPEISPKKSWAGFWGGLATAVIAGGVLYYVGWLDFPLIHCVILSVLMNIASVFGDLFESQWKRHYGIKDSGKIMPGHGGLLDRFDSSLFAIPVGAIYLMMVSLFV